MLRAGEGGGPTGAARARPKDFADVAELDRLGWDEARMNRVMEAFATIEVTCPAHGE